MTSRRGIVIGAALAAAAILVPLAGIALTRDEGPARDDGTGSTPSPSVTRSASGTPTATPTPSPTPTPEPSPTDADPQPWRVSGLTTGRPPAVPYVVNGRIHLPDGTTLATGGAPSPLLRLADERWLSTTFDQETSESEVELRDARFGLLSRFPLQSYAYPVLSPTGQTAVWARPDGSVLALQAGAAKPTVVGSVPEGGTVGAVTGDDCRSSCAIYGTSGSSAGAPLPGAWSMDASGTIRAVDDSLLTVFDAVPEARLVGYTEITDDGSCSALVDAATGSTRWTTCANSLDSFSPDGALVLASEAYHDGWGSGEIGIYDAATGLRLLDLVRTGERFSGYQQALWEDDGHLLVTTYADGAWEIVRIGVDGSMEYALPPVPGDELGGVVQLVVG